VCRGPTLRLGPGLERLTVLSDSLGAKSDLRDHQAIVQPRLYDCLMVTVTQITLKTEGPHGLPSDRLPAEVDPLPLRRGLISSY
jgi:hypothetical protein